MSSDLDQLLDIAQVRFAASSASTDAVYTKSGAIGTLGVVLSAAGYALLDAERLPRCASDAVVFLYFVSALVLFTLLAFMWIWLASAIVPKSEYQELASLRSYFDKHKISIGESPDNLVAMKSDMLAKLIGADVKNCSVNECRMKRVRVAACLAVFSAINLMVMGLLDFILVVME